MLNKPVASKESVYVNYIMFFPIIPVEKHNHCVVWCQLYRLNLVQLRNMLLVLFKYFFAQALEKLNFKNLLFIQFLFTTINNKKYQQSKSLGRGVGPAPVIVHDDDELFFQNF